MELTPEQQDAYDHFEDHERQTYINEAVSAWLNDFINRVIGQEEGDHETYRFEKYRLEWNDTHNAIMREALAKIICDDLHLLTRQEFYPTWEKSADEG